MEIRKRDKDAKPIFTTTIPAHTITTSHRTTQIISIITTIRHHINRLRRHTNNIHNEFIRRAKSIHNEEGISKLLRKNTASGIWPGNKTQYMSYA